MAELQWAESIAAQFELRKPSQCLAVDPSQSLVAVACSSEMRLLRINYLASNPLSTSSNAVAQFTELSSFEEIRSTISDVVWSRTGNSRIALSYSNGHIICLDVDTEASSALRGMKGSESGKAAGKGGSGIAGPKSPLSTAWSSGRISSAVNRLSWHPTESNVLASANQDGIVRIFDFRFHEVACQVSSFNQRGFVPTKDVQFDPFHEHIFAEVLDNGSMKIWDRRLSDRPLLTKMKAHNGSITSVAWCPCWEWVLATGSKDKTIKLWDISVCNGTTDDAAPLAHLQSYSSIDVDASSSAAVPDVLMLGGGANSISLGGQSPLETQLRTPLPQQGDAAALAARPAAVGAGKTSNKSATISLESSSARSVSSMRNMSSQDGRTRATTASAAINSAVATHAAAVAHTASAPSPVATKRPPPTLGSADFMSTQAAGGPRSRSASGTNATCVEPVIINTIHAPSEVARMGWSDFYFNPHHSDSNEESLKVGAAIKSLASAACSSDGTDGRSTSSTRRPHHTHTQQQQREVFPLLASVSTGVGSSAESMGHITVWDAMNTNIPINVMQAHSNEMCADFNWVMMQLSANSTAAAEGKLFEAPKTLSKAQLEQQQQQLKQRGKQGEGAPSAAIPSAAKSKRGGRSLSRRGNAKSPPLPDSQLSQPTLKVFMGVVTVSRDGKLILQNMKSSLFPHEHIARNVTAISSQGHVAYQTAVGPSLQVMAGSKYPSFNVFKETLSNFYAVHSKHLHHNQPMLYSSSGAAAGALSRRITKNQATARGKRFNEAAAAAAAAPYLPAAENECTDRACISRKAGIVSVGMEVFQTLQETQRIRSVRGAEAGITDPALIAIFARKYRIDPLINDTFDSSLLAVADVRSLSEEQQIKWLHQAERMHEYALDICSRNIEFARSAGLNCRVSVWSALRTLLPKPRLPEDTVEEVSLNSGLLPLPLGYTSETRLDQLLEASEGEAQGDSGKRSRSPSSGDLAALASSGRFKAADLSNALSLPILTRNSCQELPFAAQVLARMISELLEGGDAQHFVMCCEVLRTANALKDVCGAENIDLSPERVRQGYLVYLDLLTKLQLFCEANDIIKASKDPKISQLSKMGVTIEVRCGQCGKDVVNNRSTGWCQRCSRCVTACALCNQPISGLYDWCPLCAHGGHLRCMQRWFRIYRDCPAGCGHMCCSSLLRNSVNGRNGKSKGSPPLALECSPKRRMTDNQQLTYRHQSHHQQQQHGGGMDAVGAQLMGSLFYGSRVEQRRMMKARRKEILSAAAGAST